MTRALLTVLTLEQMVKAIVGLTDSSLAQTKTGTRNSARSYCIFHRHTFGKEKKIHLRIFSIKQQKINFI